MPPLAELFDWILHGASHERSNEEQAAADKKAENLTIYHSSTCAYCFKVEMVLKHCHIKIDHKDVDKDSDAANELWKKGGSNMVPCLRLTKPSGDVWLYESADIMKYIKKEFP